MRLINPIIPGEYRYPTITPFTIPDGHTYLKTLEWLIHRMKQIIDEIDENNVEILDLVVDVLNSKIDEINDAFTEFEGEVDDKLASVDTKISDLETLLENEVNDLEAFVNDSIESIINNSVEVQDPVVAGIVRDEDSETRLSLDPIYKRDVENGFIPGVRVLVTSASGKPVLSNSDPYTVAGSSGWSHTKMINNLTIFRLFPNTDLTQLVTITAEDARRTSSRIGVGDQVSVEDLLYLAALPSDNMACNALARHYGGSITGDLETPTQRFLHEMNVTLSELELTGAIALNVASFSRMSMHHAVLLCRQLQLNSTLKEIYSADTREIIVRGDNARNVTINSTSLAFNGVEGITPGVRKTGTGNVYGNFVSRFTVDETDDVYYVCVLGSVPGNQRYNEAEKAIKAVLKGVTFEKRELVHNNTNVKSTENDTGWWDITERINGAERSGDNSGFYIRRKGTTVMLRCQSVLFNSGFARNILPLGFRPDTWVSQPAAAHDQPTSFQTVRIDNDIPVTLGENGFVAIRYSSTHANITFRNCTINETHFQIIPSELDFLNPPEQVHSVLAQSGQTPSISLARLLTGGSIAVVLGSNLNGTISWQYRMPPTPRILMTTAGTLNVNSNPLVPLSFFMTYDVYSELIAPDPSTIYGISLSDTA